MGMKYLKKIFDDYVLRDRQMTTTTMKSTTKITKKATRTTHSMMTTNIINQDNHEYTFKDENKDINNKNTTN